MRAAQSQHRQSCDRFLSAPFAPSRPVFIIQAPAFFEEPLRPRIVLAVRGINDPDGRPRGDGALEQDASGKRFVVRVWGDHHQSCRRIENRVHQGFSSALWLRNWTWNGVNPRSRAWAQNKASSFLPDDRRNVCFPAIRNCRPS